MVIAHATDLSGDDRAALEHAAAIAAHAGTRLISVSAAPGAAPDVGSLAAAWRRTIDHEFRRVDAEDDVSDAVIEAVRALAPALVVVGTHARHGVAAFLHPSVSEAIARNLAVPVLVVPNQCHGFVDRRTGALALERLVIPAGTLADARRGLDAARRLLALVSSTAQLELLHVGAPDPELAQLDVHVTQVDGPLERSIIDRDASLIVMATHGHDGLADVLRGSHTERVIHDARCPVLSVPA